MKKKLLALSLALVTLTGGVVFASDVRSKNELALAEKTILSEPITKDGGARSTDFAGDHEESPYFKAPDFYNMISNETLTIIPQFKTYQQSTEWSCANATALMVMQHFGDTSITEGQLARAMKSHTDMDVEGAQPGSANNYGEYGTSLPQIAEYFSTNSAYKLLETNYKFDKLTDKDLLTEEDGVTPAKVGNVKQAFSSMSLYTSENKDDSEKYVKDAKDSYFVKWLTSYLDKGIPVMIEWGDWGGHWQAIIGYDSMGTPTIADDVLIFADPYDTTDHSQDGYFIYSLERWFYMWSDTNVVQKPYQVQNFVVVDRAN